MQSDASDPTQVDLCCSLNALQDLEATLSQAEAIAEIKKMKHAMTPRVPQLHNRTLSGNIFDQSLGILQDSILDGNGITTELLDSDHAHLPIIGKEVSISQEESENFLSDDHRYSQHEGGVEESDTRMDAVNCSPEKFACSDDTPGIGMEVVCTEVPDASATFAMHQLHESENSIVSSHNGMVNGFGGISPPPPPPPHEPHPTFPSMMDVLQSPSKGTEGFMRGSDKIMDLEVYTKLLQDFQDSRYDLRFPVQRYQAKSSSTSHTLPAAAHTSARKRGRPRKYPLQQPTPTS